MGTLRRKSLARADEVRTLPGGSLHMFELGDGLASYTVFEPGWRWSTDVRPIAGTEFCEFHHVGYTLSGRVRVAHRDGAEIEVGPEEFFEIPPLHDAWVVGDEPWISVDWGSGSAFGLEAGLESRRRVATLLFTDIVESTATARQLGDARWRDVLLRHNELVRGHLMRYRGREVTTTGDGFLALFESAESAVRAGLAIASTVPVAGVEVRCAVHTGEVELVADNVQGLSVHIAARVLALAGPGDVLVSWTTRELLAGSKLDFEDRGTHELKGLPEPRPIYAVSALATP